MEQTFYNALRETVFHRQLPNGLDVYVDIRPDYEKQFAFFATRYGGMNLRFQGEDGHWVNTPAGVAHFLEHKMFDTEDGNALQKLAANGVDPNAFTSSSLTGYYFEGTHSFEENLHTLLSFVSVPYFTEESVAREQGIIAQEIRMGDDSPEHALYYQQMEAMYQKHPIRVRVIGTEESIAQITADTLYRCHRAFYNPANMVLCVAGNVNPERVCAIAAEVLPKEGVGAAETDYGEDEPQGVETHLVERQMPVAVPLFQLSFKGDAPGRGEELRQRLVGELLCDTLFSPSAPLYTRLYEEGLINSSFESGYESVPGCAYLGVGGESRSPELVRERVMEEVERLRREGIDAQLWNRQKKAAYGGMIRRLNSLEDTCIELAISHFSGEDYLCFPELYQTIEPEDGQAMLEHWLTPERAVLSVIRPSGEEP